MTSLEDGLFEAAKKGYADDFQALFKAKQLNFNVTDIVHNTPLHYAAGAGHVDCVKLLLTVPSIKINIQNNVGDTPLHRAAAGRTEAHAESATVLVAAKADVTVKNKAKQTAYDICLNAAKGVLLPGGGDVAGFDPEALGISDSEDEDDE